MEILSWVVSVSAPVAPDRERPRPAQPGRAMPAALRKLFDPAAGREIEVPFYRRSELKTGWVVRGPAVIGAGAVLTDCYVGPYSSIGERCTITNAEVEHSILLSGCTVCDLDGRMESSLLGRNVTVRRGERQPRAYRFMVGDNSDISIL